jgi:hypothetical protein
VLPDKRTGDEMISRSPVIESFHNEIENFIDRLTDLYLLHIYESYGFFMASPGFFMESPCIEPLGFFMEAPDIALAGFFIAPPRLLLTRLFLRAIFVADTVVSLGVVTDVDVWVAAAWSDSRLTRVTDKQVTRAITGNSFIRMIEFLNG